MIFNIERLRETIKWWQTQMLGPIHRSYYHITMLYDATPEYRYRPTNLACSMWSKQIRYALHRSTWLAFTTKSSSSSREWSPESEWEPISSDSEETVPLIDFSSSPKFLPSSEYFLESSDGEVCVCRDCIKWQCHMLVSSVTILIYDTEHYHACGGAQSIVVRVQMQRHAL